MFQFSDWHVNRFTLICEFFSSHREMLWSRFLFSCCSSWMIGAVVDVVSQLETIDSPNGHRAERCSRDRLSLTRDTLNWKVIGEENWHLHFWSFFSCVSVCIFSVICVRAAEWSDWIKTSTEMFACYRRMAVDSATSMTDLHIGTRSYSSSWTFTGRRTSLPKAYCPSFWLFI